MPSRNIPIRLTEDQIRRLDQVAERIGQSRSTVVRMCTRMFVEDFERGGGAALPVDWGRIIRAMDSRTREAKALVYDDEAQKPKMVAEGNRTAYQAENMNISSSVKNVSKARKKAVKKTPKKKAGK